MSSHHEHTPAQRAPHVDDSGPLAERLPADFELSLHTLDASLAEHLDAWGEDVPHGLADRVYEASVGELPRSTPSHEHTRRRVMPLVEVFLLPITEPWRGRLAMAASLLITMSLAMMFYTRQQAIVPDGPDIANSVRQVDLSWLDESPLDAVDSEVGYLLHTGEMSSHEELADELEQILNDLG